MDAISAEEIRAIRGAIREKDHRWSAGLTPLSKLSEEERKGYLGLAVQDQEMETTFAAILEADVMHASEGLVFVYPPRWDWRNVLGRDWTTPIRDQGGCGSCVAFGTVATVESNLEIALRRPALDPDLSEADLFFCGCGKCCKTGWTFVPALNYAKNKGIPDEACYPYKPMDQSCTPCKDRDRRAVKITNWREIRTVAQAKEWISRKGPLLTGMAVYSDFFSYRGGIYRHSTGGLAGYHAICTVGYEDVDRYWICKNSWGTGWGERGWFRIRYGECGIGDRFFFYTAEFPGIPRTPVWPAPVPAP